MSNWICPRCGGGFPNFRTGYRECPWCQLSIGEYDPAKARLFE